MDLNYPQDFYSNISSSQQTTHHDLLGTARSYECIFCKRGFTTAQALGGHMNIHRKERANNKTKPSFSPSPPSTSNKLHHHGPNNYADLVFHSQIPTCSTAPHANTFPDLCFPSTSLTVTPSHAEVLCAEKDQLGHVLQDWSTTNLSLYSNPLCFQEIKNTFEDTEENNGLDLELRLGHHP